MTSSCTQWLRWAWPIISKYTGYIPKKAGYGMKCLVRLLIAAGFIAATGAFAQTNGIFADFSTSMGNFSVYLDYEAAPRAVASFVGLATGEISWADETGNVWIDRPFYAGSLIHRVVKDANTNGMAIQGGGWLYRTTGTNGVVTTNFSNAGYYMLDNVTNGLTHSNGVISMANSGPNTDGSQFFITTTNVSYWDGGYTVFGHVSTGMNVVTSIAGVAVSGSGLRPVTDIVVSNVAIRRVGAAAQAFNIASQGVPVVESGPMALARSDTNELLVIEIAEETEMLFRETSDLVTWESSDWGFYTGSTFIWTTSVARASLGDSYFFHLSRIFYPVPITSPSTQRGQVFTFVWDKDPVVVYEATFSDYWYVQGDYVVQTGTNSPISGKIFIGDSWTQDPYSARLYFYDDSMKEYYYNLGFNPGQETNRFTGYYVTGGYTYTITGTFTVTDP